MNCNKILEVKCSKGHVQKRKCHETRPQPCKKCEIDDERDTKILERDLELQEKRLREEVKHNLNVADLDMQIRKIREEVEDKQTAWERARILEQKKRDLETTKRQAAQSLQQASPKVSQVMTSTNNDNGKIPRQPDAHGKKPTATSKPTNLTKSASELEWERQKKVEGASNTAIDDLMGLTGLEEVKEKFLDIKAKIETVARQGIDMKKERMGMVMLGNPGTGMHH